MSKGLRTVLPIAAMFIPVVGPAIGAKIGLSTTLTGIAAKAGLTTMAGKVGSIASGALVGGALSKAAGGSFISGAVGGGLGGAAGLGGTGGAEGGAEAATTPASLGGRVMGAIQSAGGQIAQGLTDPNMWGRAAMYLGAAAIGKATSKPDPALQAYVNELQRVSAANMEVRNAAFGIGQELATEARNISPVGMGQVQSQEAMTRVLGASAENIRNLPTYAAGGRSAMEAQGRLAAAKAGATAFNTGYTTGQEQRRTGLATAYSGVPQLQAQGGTAAQLSMQQGLNEGNRQAGILESLKYVTTGQQPTREQQPKQEEVL